MKRVGFRRIIILAASALIELLIGALLGWGVFVPLLVREYGFSASLVQSIFGTSVIVFALSVFVFGRLIRFAGERGLIITGALLYISSWLLAGLNPGKFIWLLLTISLLQSIAVSAIYIALLQLCVDEFPERAGTVTGILLASYGLGASLLAFIIEYLAVSQTDVPSIFTGMAGIYGIPVLLLGLLVVALRRHSDIYRPILAAVKPGAYIIALMLFMMSATMSGYAILSNMGLLVASLRWPSGGVALAITLFAVGNSLGRLAWGAISDAIGAHRSMLLSVAVQMAVLLYLGSVSSYGALIPLALFLAGSSFGSCLVLLPARVNQYYGGENVGSVYSIVLLATTVSGLIGPSLGGWGYEHFGNYLLTMRIIFMVLLAGTSGYTIFTVINARSGRRSR